MSDKHLFLMLDMPLSLPQWCFDHSKHSVRLEHWTKVAVNNTTLWFRTLLCRSTEQSYDADKRHASLDMKHLPVEAAVERLVVLLCSRKRLPARKNLVEHKPSCRPNMAPEQLASVPEFVAERNVPQWE